MKSKVATSQLDVSYDAIVIGAGIAGVLTALTLQTRGLKTLIVDKGEPGEGCSFGNGGAIGENTCSPFGQPGIIRQLPRWYLDPDGPVVVNPAWALRSIPWIARWLLSSRADPTYHAARGMAFLHHGCLEIYRKFLGANGYADLIRDEGYLYVYETPTPTKSEIFAAKLRDELGIPSQVLSKEELRQAEPCLSPIFQRGLFLPGNSHTINPHRLVTTLFRSFLAAGGMYHRTVVQGFYRRGATILGIDTADGRVHSRSVVICAGSWSGPLAQQLDVHVPLAAERGYHIFITGSPFRMNHKVMNATRGFGATSMEAGLQISGTVELADVDAAPNWRRAEALLRNARTMFACDLGEKHTVWMGCRPSLPDSLPIVEAVPTTSNAYLNFGHSHWGLSGAPRSAELIADLIMGQTLPEAAAAFRSARFRFGAPRVPMNDATCTRKVEII